MEAKEIPKVHPNWWRGWTLEFTCIPKDDPRSWLHSRIHSCWCLLPKQVGRVTQWNIGRHDAVPTVRCQSRPRILVMGTTTCGLLKKYCLPHCAINMRPFQAYTGQHPSAKSLRVFGCPVVARLPGQRPAKLDPNTATGIFLGYTSTDHNI